MATSTLVIGWMTRDMEKVLLFVNYLGKLISVNGDNYDGEWRDDKKNGPGTYL